MVIHNLDQVKFTKFFMAFLNKFQSSLFGIEDSISGITIFKKKLQAVIPNLVVFAKKYFMDIFYSNLYFFALLLDNIANRGTIFYNSLVVVSFRLLFRLTCKHNTFICKFPNTKVDTCRLGNFTYVFLIQSILLTIF